MFDQAKPICSDKLFVIQKKLNYNMRCVFIYNASLLDVLIFYFFSICGQVYSGGLVDWSQWDEGVWFTGTARSCGLRRSLSTISTNISQLATVNWNHSSTLGSQVNKTCHFYTKLLSCYLYRWNGASIITVREAAWLTENTYRYEDVVRTVGEMLAVFNGQIRVSILLLSSHPSPLSHMTSVRSLVLQIISRYCWRFVDLMSGWSTWHNTSQRWLYSTLNWEC